MTLQFAKDSFCHETSNIDAAVLCSRLRPFRWMTEGARQPPPQHHPALLFRHNSHSSALAISLTTATVVALSLGPSLSDRLAELGAAPGPLVGLASQELITNAAIHGNLHVQSGRSEDWADLSQRHAAIGAALANPTLAARYVTIALGWTADAITCVVSDEGDGYDSATTNIATRCAGRGLRIARLIGRLQISQGGSQAVLTVHRHAGGHLA